MAEPSEDIQKLSPDKLLKGFNHAPLLLSIVVAVGIHLVILGVDIGYGLVAGEPDEDQQVAAADDGDTAEKASPDGKPAGPADGNAPRADANDTADKEYDPNDSEVVKDTKDVREAPAEPDIDLGDTNF
jgi:hypothetical protein